MTTIQTETEQLLRRLALEAIAGPLGSKQRAELQTWLVDHYGCADCGAAAGAWCLPDYGCKAASRNRPGVA